MPPDYGIAAGFLRDPNRPVTGPDGQRLVANLLPSSTPLRMRLPLLLLLPGVLVAQAVTAPVSRDVLKLDTMKVSGARVSANEAQGPDLMELFGEQDILDSGAFDIDEFLGQLPPSEAGEEVLVLIDGQVSYLPISQLPLDMIQNIEVANNGALSQYGAYANGRVVNIRLKTNHRSENLLFNSGGSFRGDGLKGGFAFASTVKRDKSFLHYGVSYRRSAELMASDRPFSRDQDHTARGGQDLRLLWGDTAVVRAVTGNLTGVFDVNGQPTSVALAPADQDGRGLAPADFLPAQVFAPATVATAPGQRRFNTSRYVSLIAPNGELSANFGWSRPFGKQSQIQLSSSVNRNNKDRTLAPPVTAASATTLVPAAYNPFGQDVQVGFVHAGFGPVREESRSTAASLGLRVNGRVADTWDWNIGVRGQWDESTQQVTDLDREAFTASLAAADPALRFNPFGDDPHNLALYPGLTVIRGSATESRSTRADAGLRGQIGKLPGGPIRLSVNGRFNDQTRTKNYENPLTPVAADPRRHDNNQDGTVTFTLPWVGQKNGRPWLRRLETNVMGGYSSRSGTPGETLNGGFGLQWSPHKAFSLRGRFEATHRAPSRFLSEAAALAGETLLDPRRFPPTTPEVQVIERDFDGVLRARSETFSLAATLDAPFVTGLQLSVTYNQSEQQDLTSSRFRAQDLIYNELTFPGRVVRAAPTEDDIRLGQPGRIISVDRTPSDQAAQASSNLSWRIQYRRRSEQFGTLNVFSTVQHALTRRYEVMPGVPFVFESNNNLNPPPWRQTLRASWSRKGWQVSTNFHYQAEVQSGTFVQPATKRLGLQLSYRFARPFLGKLGPGAQLRLSFEDLLEGTPPFADTINGYRNGSPLGRTWSLTMSLPLRPPNARGQQGDGGPRIMDRMGDDGDDD
jgi:iron complex outermembrane receptor protein